MSRQQVRFEDIAEERVAVEERRPGCDVEDSGAV
jgi:hypothetical protein